MGQYVRAPGTPSAVYPTILKYVPDYYTIVKTIFIVYFY